MRVIRPKGEPTVLENVLRIPHVPSAKPETGMPNVWLSSYLLRPSGARKLLANLPACQFDFSRDIIDSCVVTLIMRRVGDIKGYVVDHDKFFGHVETEGDTRRQENAGRVTATAPQTAIAPALQKQPSKVDAIINSCNNTRELEYTRAVIRQLFGAHVRFFVYEKCGNSDATRWKLPNKGREFQTYAHHVATHYDDLADMLVFTPADLRTKRATREHILRTAASSNSSFYCGAQRHSHGTHGKLVNWVHKHMYEGRKLDVAQPQGLKAWAMKHIGHYGANDELTCQYGTFVTTRDLVHNNKRDAYERISQELFVDEPEAGHYCERLARDIFGYRA